VETRPLLILAGIAVVMLSLSPYLALLTLSVIPLMVLVTWWFATRANGDSQESSRLFRLCIELVDFRVRVR